MAVEVGVRELRESLSEWLDRAAAGEDVIVTERGKPKVRLSAATGEHIIDLLFDLQRRRQATLVLVTHEMGLAGRCGRVVRMADGRIEPELASA